MWIAGLVQYFGLECMSSVHILLKHEHIRCHTRSSTIEYEYNVIWWLQLILQTNIPFLLNVMQNEKFLKGQVDTYFIDDHPDL